jgi:hypothetical protein
LPVADGTLSRAVAPDAGDAQSGVAFRTVPARDPAAAGRLALAVQVLASGTEPLAGRLEEAGEIIGTLRNHEFNDPESRELFEQILKGLTQHAQPPGRGGLRTSALAEREDLARSLAMDIVRLDRHLSGAQFG